MKYLGFRGEEEKDERMEWKRWMSRKVIWGGVSPGGRRIRNSKEPEPAERA
jgi:hypothetical protein